MEFLRLAAPEINSIRVLENGPLRGPRRPPHRGPAADALRHPLPLRRGERGP